LLGIGDGTFGAPVSNFEGPNPGWLGVADFNGDGRTDIAVTNSSTNSVAVLLGIGPVTATMVALTSSVNPVTYGQNVTLTAAVSAGGTPPGSGRVTFYDGTAVLGSAAVAGNGSAGLTTRLVSTGTRLLRAYYSGGGGYAASTSVALPVNVNALSSNAFRTPANYSAGNYPWMLASGDFNGDGIADLVSSNFLSNNLSVQWNISDGSQFACAESASSSRGRRF